jgi:hypothetical protein
LSTNTANKPSAEKTDTMISDTDIIVLKDRIRASPARAGDTISAHP